MEKQNYLEITETIPIADFRIKTGNPEFLQFWFTEAELEKYSPDKHSNSLACRYLVKKIIIEKINYRGSAGQISILSDLNGKPVLDFNPFFIELIQNKGFKSIICSLSHSRITAAAMVVFEKIDRNLA